MKESRLFQILYYILENGRVTASELAGKFEVSIRTIYRDIDWISSVGIPIYTAQGKGGGIKIDNNFVLSKSLLSDNEKEQIMIALNGIKNTNELYKNNLVSKLSALFKMKNENWIEMDFTNWQSNKSYKKIFYKIKSAIIEKKIITFQYFNNNYQETKREIKPIRLIFKGQDWYLYAFCNLRNNFRFFKLSRIKNLETSEIRYDDDFSNIVIDKEITPEKTVHLKLKFDKKQAFRVYDELDCEIKKDENNNLYAEIDISKNYLLYYILSFGDGVEVLEPEEVRTKIKEILNKMLRKYKT